MTCASSELSNPCSAPAATTAVRRRGRLGGRRERRWADRGVHPRPARARGSAGAGDDRGARRRRQGEAQGSRSACPRADPVRLPIGGGGEARARRERGTRPAHPDENAELVRRIYADAKAGDAPAKIARVLNREGVASPQGREWSRQTIRLILANPIYAGERYGVKGAQPAFVSRRTWNAVRALLGG
jgi:hypothetical protein